MRSQTPGPFYLVQANLSAAIIALLFSAGSAKAGLFMETRYLKDDSGAFAPLAPLRSIIARRCRIPPKIDGSLDEAPWRQAKPEGGFFVLRKASRRMLRSVAGEAQASSSRILAARRTTIRLLYDSRYLYIGFNVEAPDAASLRRNKTRNDDMLLWQDDTVELMLDPDCDRTRYFHFMINPNGKVTDSEFGPGIGRTERGKWTARWRCASRLGAGRWIVELAIPFNDLGVEPPAPGTVWLGNFCHNTYSRFRRKLSSGIEVRMNGEASSWIPLNSQFHEPLSFGEIVFERFPRVKIAAVKWNKPAWGLNVAAVTLGNRGTTPVEVTAAIQGMTTVPGAVVLRPQASGTVRVPYFISERGKTLTLKQARGFRGG